MVCMKWQDAPILRTLWTLARSYTQARRFRRSIEASLAADHAERDRVEARESTPPETEHIEFQCVWVTEVYTPSSINGLVAALRKLGWDRPEYSLVPGASLTEQIQHTRSGRDLSSWVNVGIILPPGDTRFLGIDKRYAKLPLGVDHCRIVLRNATASLTLLTVQFVLTDEYACRLNEPLSAHYHTTVTYYPSSWRCTSATFQGVVEQKKRAVNQYREELHKNLWRWLARNLPGHYASAVDATYPTIDLITSRTYVRAEDERRSNDYLSIVLGADAEPWLCTDDDHLELRLPGFDMTQPVATLFGNYQALVQESEMYGNKDRWALINRLDWPASGLAAMWATHHLLISYEQGLATVRDRASSGALGVLRALRDIKYIQQHYLAISRDIQTVTKDIAAIAGSRWRHIFTALDFAVPINFRDFSPDFVEALRTRDEGRAKHLNDIDERVGKTVLVSGDLAVAAANIRIQGYVLFLTVITVIFALVALLKH